MSFRYEDHMLNYIISDQIINEILVKHNKTHTIYYGCEVNNLFGIPDVVFSQFNKESLLYSCAIELKLSNWKRALEQAFRYKSFAEYSYVILDNSRTKPAIKNLPEFKKRNIGLLGMDDNGNLHKYHIPEARKPYSFRLVQVLSEMAIKQNGFREFSFDIG